MPAPFYGVICYLARENSEIVQGGKNLKKKKNLVDAEWKRVWPLHGSSHLLKFQSTMPCLACAVQAGMQAQADLADRQRRQNQYGGKRLWQRGREVRVCLATRARGVWGVSGVPRERWVRTRSISPGTRDG